MRNKREECYDLMIMSATSQRPQEYTYRRSKGTSMLANECHMLCLICNAWFFFFACSLCFFSIMQFRKKKSMLLCHYTMSVYVMEAGKVIIS